MTFGTQRWANPDALRAVTPSLAERETLYLVDRREIAFFLWELFNVDREFLGRAPFDGVDRRDVEALLIEAQSFAAKLGSCYSAADRSAARLEQDGSVAVPPMFPSLWREFRHNWRWIRRMGRPDVAGGDRNHFPTLVVQMLSEMFLGANPAFMTYGGFTASAVNLIEQHGTPEQKRLMIEPLKSDEWDACFCATEEQAGSDLSAIATTADHLYDDVYSVRGQKKFISAGMHELTGNTIYVVLARVNDPKSTAFSLSCFLVPRFWIDVNGERRDNHVRCVHVEDKMGFAGCANTQLAFSADGPTRGFLLANRRNVGLPQLVALMRDARISTGQFALGMASSAYLHALRYARKRVQGRRFAESLDVNSPQIPIVEHADVQRMLLEMKARADGCRGLIGRLIYHMTKIQQLHSRTPIDEEAVGRHQRLVLLYTPLVKAYVSDEAWRIANLAIQVHGGVGYLRDLPLEQYARDIRVLSIWEGTNYIQAQDLVRDKLRFGRKSLLMRHFVEDVDRFLARRDAFPQLSDEFERLRAALATLTVTLDRIRELADARRYAAVSQFCTRFLEMFGEVAVGWSLLEAACVAANKLASLPPNHCDAPFYSGKIKAARFFIYNILPGVAAKAALLDHTSRAFVELEEAEFGFIDSPPTQRTAIDGQRDGEALRTAEHTAEVMT